jgi:hypothetical protein
LTFKIQSHCIQIKLDNHISSRNNTHKDSWHEELVTKNKNKIQHKGDFIREQDHMFMDIVGSNEIGG